MRKDLAEELVLAMNAPEGGLAQAALVIARLEYPQLKARPYLAHLDRIGNAARRLIKKAVLPGPHHTSTCFDVLSDYLFWELRFTSNREHYYDPRNSCLNQVLDRRLGIPVTLSVIYIEVARRAGLTVEGVNFPGHFLVRGQDRPGGQQDFIIDPYQRGARLSQDECRDLLKHYAGSEAAFDSALLAPASRVQIVARMLLNLKQLYVRMRSFQQAREVAELLVELTPAPLAELRDRGLIAYHLNDVTSALRDLQTYLKLSGMRELSAAEQSEHELLWEYVKTLRRRVAGLN